MTRTGKIARLPRAVREQLNRRLADGEPGKSLVEWLNSLPETRRVLAADFSGRPVTEQNLSEWKQREHREWLARQETLAQVHELMADAEEFSKTTDGVLADRLATVLAARYAAALAGWDGEADENFRRKLRSLRGLCQDVVELRRGDHSAARLKIEQERLERDREKTEEDVVEHFKRWAANPAVREWICEKCISPEERERRLREIFGLATSDKASDESNVAAKPPESDPIQPNQTSFSDANRSNHENVFREDGNP